MQKFDKLMGATAEALKGAFDGQRPTAKRSDLKPEIREEKYEGQEA